MKDTTLGCEVGYLTDSDKEESASHYGVESLNDSDVDDDEEAVMKLKEDEKEEEYKEEEEEKEEKDKENREACVNGGRLNNDGDDEGDASEYGMEDSLGKNKNENVEEKKDHENSMETNPQGWHKDYEIRINLLRQEINETGKKHEVWQNGIRNRKEEALKRWDVIKKKHEDRVKVRRRLHGVMDSVLDNEETTKEEEEE